MKIPRPSEYLWTTSIYAHREEQFLNLQLIKVKDIWFDFVENEWLICDEDFTFFVSDCMPLEQMIIEEETLAIYD